MLVQLIVSLLKMVVQAPLVVILQKPKTSSGDGFGVGGGGRVGSEDGSEDGAGEGSGDGSQILNIVGLHEAAGFIVGTFVGAVVGVCDGSTVDGWNVLVVIVGGEDGSRDGLSLGCWLGLYDGGAEGSVDGSVDGAFVGAISQPKSARRVLSPQNVGDKTVTSTEGPMAATLSKST
mmetsp:Transcript_7579/g.8761  ORF Transcript_7579/g.8761 Transcript_7579/m.8761 type:complete len:176 (+) Transcript_7579:511-1038(+)